MPAYKLPFNGKEAYGKKEKRLGEGSYGTVYLSKTEKGNEYANKVSDKSGDIDSTIIREISILCNLDHPNIVPIIDVWITDAKIGVVLPVAKGSLKGIIMNSDSKDISNTKFVAHDLINGVAYLTSQDIIHRDLKPDNVLYRICKKDEDTFARLWIADFGLSRSGKCMDLKFSKEVYTLWYRPPEILMGGNYDHSADVWALGCIIAETYLGRALFPGDSEIDTLIKIFRYLGTPTESIWNGVTNLPNWNNNLPHFQRNFPKKLFGDNEELFDLISKCLVLDPSKRVSIFELLDHPFIVNGIRGHFSTKDKDSCFYQPSIETLSCKNRLLELQRYPQDKFDNNDYVERYRPILVDWLVDVADEYKMSKVALGLGIYILDTFMSKSPRIPDIHKILQGIGATSLLIASKYEEIYSVSVSDISYISDKAYTETEIIAFEQEILSELGFNLTVSTSASFLSFYGSFYPENIRKLANELYELMIVTPLAFRYSGSDIALAILLICCGTLGDTFKHTQYLNNEILVIPNKFFPSAEELKFDRFKKEILPQMTIRDIEKEYRKGNIKVL